MSNLNDRIIAELQKTEVQNLSRLIQFMKGDKGFFWVRSGGHDRWTNGTAQHSWRVYQYMRYMWEPEEIRFSRDVKDPALSPDRVRELTESEIILTGLLHDLGKMWGCDHHASNSKKIIDKYLGKGFSERNPKIVAAIFFHHNKDKDGGSLNDYRHSTLKKLLNKADSMAAGTTWNSTRFIEHRSQRHGTPTSDIKHMRRVAMDRSHQVLDYKMYLDCTYHLQTIKGYACKEMKWNTVSETLKEVQNGSFKGVTIPKSSDYITSAHRIFQDGNGNVCLAVGIDMTEIKKNERNLRQGNPCEEELLICSNVLTAFYKATDIGKHRFAYSMREEIKLCYENQSPDKGIFLPQVTFFRDGVSEGFRMVAPWKCDVLLVPGWKGCAVLNTRIKGG